MRKFAVVMLVPVALFGQELVSSFSIDTNVYEPHPGYIYLCRGPDNEFCSNNNGLPTNMLISFRKKGTDQYDIFSASGLTGSIIIHYPQGATPYTPYISQTFIDNDAGFECIASYRDTLRYGAKFIVSDEMGNIMLSDTGDVAGWGFDGQNTYVWSRLSWSFKVWKFRSNISSASHPLSKTSSSPGPMMAYMPSGDFRVSLQPVSGGTSIQIFDMLGRQIFSKDIQNIREPTSFIIPSSGMPNSPFVTRVNNNNGSFAKKGIPVR